jgi:N-acetylneuraminic acid mutarotase
MKFMRLLLVFILCQCASNLHAQFWQQLPDFPGNPRDDAAGFSIQDKHYCGTGRDDGFNCTRNFYRFNGTTQNWEIATPLPDGENRQYATGFAHNGFGYILCGDNCSGNFLSSFWRFDPSNEQWSTLPALPSSGRAGCVHFIIGDSLYLIGGQNSSGILNEVWRYSINTQEWQQKNNLPIPGIWRGLAFSHENFGYISAGKSSASTWNSETWKYDPILDQWTNFPTLNFGERTYVGTVQKDSFLYVFGGLNPSNQTATSFEKVDLTLFSSQSLPNFTGIPRKGAVCFTHEGDFYVTTGISGNTRLRETWKIEDVMISIPLTENRIRVYPVPAIDELFIEIDPSCIGEFIYICDQLGKISVIHRIQSLKDQIHVGDLPPGTYQLIYRNHACPIVIGD